MSNNSFVYDILEEFTYKDKIDPVCIVEFRTDYDYDGSFGFDWLRINEPQKVEPAYGDIIEGGYKNGVEDLNQTEALKKLMKEYKTTEIKHKPFSIPWYENKNKYFVPYLNLFSKTYSDTIKVTPAPSYKAKLCVLIQIEEEIGKIEFDYNHDIFSIDTSDLLSITKKCKQTILGTIEILCKKDFDKEQLINVYAYPKMVGPVCAKPTLAGRMVVMPNSAKYRKEVKFVLVNVKTNIKSNGKDINGVFSAAEQVQLRKVCYQALVLPKISGNIILDLTNDPKFKAGIGYIDTYSRIQKQEITGGGIDIVKYLQNKFYQDANNTKYVGCFTVFSFDLVAGDGGLLGYCDSNRNIITGEVTTFLKNIVVFKSGKGRNEDVIPHESLHGFGLWHTHRELRGESVIKSPDKKYIYPHGQGSDPAKATDNVMSYRMRYMKTTWKWQWNIIRKNIL